MSALQLTIVEALRCFPGPVSMAELRVKLSETLTINSVAPVAAAVQALRYQGKVAWDRLELSDSMKSAGAPPVVEGGAAAAKVTSPPSDECLVNPEGPAPNGGVPASRCRDEEQGEGRASSAPAARLSAPSPGPDDEEDYPGSVNDAVPAPAVPPVKPAVHPPGGWTKASNIAGARPAPAPAHEPEIARLVREESTELAGRRRLARSTGTVRQPLELRKFHLPDMSIGEAVSSLLAEEPHDLVVAINRKHPELWRRILLLGRAMKLRPAEALYAVIERGLGELEPSETETVE